MATILAQPVRQRLRKQPARAFGNLVAVGTPHYLAEGTGKKMIQLVHHLRFVSEELVQVLQPLE